MKRRFPTFIYFLCILFISGIYYACTKVHRASSIKDATQIQQAKDYFEQNVLPYHNPDTSAPVAYIRSTLHKNPIWSSASVQQMQWGTTVVAPLAFKEPLKVKEGPYDIPIDSISYLLMYKDSMSVTHCEVVTQIPDTAFLNSTASFKQFSGIALVEEWSGKPIAQYSYSRGVCRRISSSSVVQQDPTTTTARIGTQGTQKQVMEIGPCGGAGGVVTETDWYACNRASDGSLFDCVYEYSVISAECYPVDGGNGSGGVYTQGLSYGTPMNNGTGTYSSGMTYPQMEAAYTMPPPKIPITDIYGYIKCFDLSGKAYTVTLCVAQPIPHDASPYTVGGPNLIDVGHTFLEFSETRADGTSIVRFMGFYPSAQTSPLKPGAPSELGDDEGHAMNVALAITMTPVQFNRTLNEFANILPIQDYNLNGFNCTTAACTALQSGGYQISCPFGQWPGGSGANPGSMGQVLYNLPPQGDSIRVITNVGSAGPNIGTCP